MPVESAIAVPLICEGYIAERQNETRTTAYKKSLATELVAKPKGDDGEEEVRRPDKDGLKHRVATSYAHLSEYARSIVDDHIDAGNLLEEGKHATEEHNLCHLSLKKFRKLSFRLPFMIPLG